VTKQHVASCLILILIIYHNNCKCTCANGKLMHATKTFNEQLNHLCSLYKPLGRPIATLVNLNTPLVDPKVP
jgi:hypothetical protein